VSLQYERNIAGAVETSEGGEPATHHGVTTGAGGARDFERRRPYKE
jgi:hypothetical protein